MAGAAPAGRVAGAAFDPARFVPVMAGAGHNGWLGIAYLAHGADWVALRLPFDPALAGDDGRAALASGPIVSMMDMASSVAVWTRRAVFVPVATLDLRVDHLRPAHAGRDVVGRCECYRLTPRIGFVRGHAHDGDPADPVAHVAGTFMFTDAA